MIIPLVTAHRYREKEQEAWSEKCRQRNIETRQAPSEMNVFIIIHCELKAVRNRRGRIDLADQ